MNRINALFQNKQKNILSVYFTAGHPSINSTTEIIRTLANSGVDMIEIGMPFSDPMADGPIIQNSSNTALKNGMSLKILFQQLNDIRQDVKIPVLLMGYLNPVLQYGMEKFCSDAASIGIDGIILPDLPLEVYQKEYQSVFTGYGLHNIFLVTPQTKEERIRKIDALGNGFIYMVSSSSTTGIKGIFGPDQVDYFERMQDMKLKNPMLIGFGISNNESFNTVCKYAHGAIIGSAFVKMISESEDIRGNIISFVKEIKEGK